MNMLSTIMPSGEQEALGSLHQLLAVALSLVDELELPGRIGPDIDHALALAEAMIEGSSGTARLN